MSRKEEVFPRKSIHVEGDDIPLALLGCIFYGKGDFDVVMGIDDGVGFEREHGQFKCGYFLWG